LRLSKRGGDARTIYVSSSLGWEEVRRRGFSSGIFLFLGCIGNETEREIQPYYSDRRARDLPILRKREGS